jgi:hypothetical protein
LSGLLGTPIEAGVRMLPRPWHRRVHGAVRLAMDAALGAALRSLGEAPAASPPRERRQRLYCMGTGAVGGLFGLAGLAAELPLTTTLMLRGIAEIARDEGEDLSTARARVDCLQVFALGTPSASDDAADTGYYGVRLAMAASVSNASSYLAQHGLQSQGAPVLVQLMAGVASRFGIAVTQKTAAQLLPIIGAASGAAINTAFMQHYQDVARAHFCLRALERRYGEEVVQATYRAGAAGP